ncbi:uncharacterized protein LOC124448017, partial [Xenia sp. Carnegie-2017]|uniref:uncharacterized protein LOC124448017 n=1 Tax=Xenia sp. Carnegie-2017 TaxID=2897299 RepID=UPI001F04BF1C
IDQHLSWKSHTDKICKKVAAGISALRKLKEYTDKQTLISIYNALVHPYFTYCCEVWGVLGETQSKRLQSFKIELTNSLKKSFAYDGASVWNSIPAEFRNSKSVSLLLLAFYDLV